LGLYTEVSFVGAHYIIWKVQLYETDERKLFSYSMLFHYMYCMLSYLIDKFKNIYILAIITASIQLIRQST